MPNRPTSKPPSRILPIAAIALILIGLGIRFLSRDDTPPPATTTAPAPTQPTETAATPVELDTPSPRRDPALPFNPRGTEIRRVEEDEDVPETENPYAGEWYVFASDGTQEVEAGRAHLFLESPELIRVETSALSGMNELHVDGETVHAEFGWNEVTAKLSGAFNADKTELQLSGIARFQDPTRNEDYEWEMHLRFAPVPRDQVEREARLDEYQNHARDILDMIQEFAKENGGIPPQTLAELVPNYVEDAADIESTADREIAYDPNGTLSPPAAPFERDTPVHLMAPAELIAYEQELARHWDGDLYSPRPVLTVRYPNDGYVVYADGLRGTGYDDLSAERDNNIDLEALVDACQNNLKRLGLVGKMHENEHPERRWPAGPYHVYPEYLPDPNVMTCPTAERGVISYEYIFPAANETELHEMFREVTGADPEQVPSQSQIPMMYETHICATGDSSNVLFLDGHVELLTPDEFAERIEPFLRVRIH